jgi:dihydroorotase
MGAAVAAGAARAMAGEHELVIRNVQALINGTFAPRDLAIAGGRIAAVAPAGTLTGARVLERPGLHASPGWVDLHCHYVDWKHRKSAGSSIAQLGLGEGVTALVDTGTVGAANYERLEQAVADAPRPAPECFALLNIQREGIKLSEFYRTKVGWDDFPAMEKVIAAHRDRIVGLKYRADHQVSDPKDRLYYVRKIREAGDAFKLPVMIHIGDPPPSLVEVLPYLKAGDIVTHFLRPANNAIVDEAGKLRPEVKQAYDRGVKFDVGHGMGSYSFFTAQAALEEGFTDFTISSDLYIASRPLYAKTFANVLTNVLVCGMPLADIMERASTRPAKFLGLQREIKEGAEATLTLFSVDNGAFTCTDVKGNKRASDRRIIPWWTIFKGQEISAGARDRKLYL